MRVWILTAAYCLAPLFLELHQPQLLALGLSRRPAQLLWEAASSAIVLLMEMHK